MCRGHTLIGRIAGDTVPSHALGNLQGQALHEGIADFVAMLVNVGNVEPHATYALGAYTNLDYIESRPTLPPGEAPADAMYYGIRRYPFSLDLAKNPLTFQHITTPPPITAAVTGAATFPGGAGGDVARQAVGHTAGATLPVVVNACLLPAHPTQTGFRAFDYIVVGSSPDEPACSTP